MTGTQNTRCRCRRWGSGAAGEIAPHHRLPHHHRPPPHNTHTHTHTHRASIVSRFPWRARERSRAHSRAAWCAFSVPTSEGLDQPDTMPVWAADPQRPGVAANLDRWQPRIRPPNRVALCDLCSTDLFRHLCSLYQRPFAPRHPKLWLRRSRQTKAFCAALRPVA